MEPRHPLDRALDRAQRGRDGAVATARSGAVAGRHQSVYISDTEHDRIVRTDLLGGNAQVVSTGADTPEGHLGGPEYLEWDYERPAVRERQQPARSTCSRSWASAALPARPRRVAVCDIIGGARSAPFRAPPVTEGHALHHTVAPLTSRAAAAGAGAGADRSGRGQVAVGDVHRHGHRRRRRLADADLLGRLDRHHHRRARLGQPGREPQPEPLQAGRHARGQRLIVDDQARADHLQRDASPAPGSWASRPSWDRPPTRCR